MKKVLKTKLIDSLEIIKREYSVKSENDEFNCLEILGQKGNYQFSVEVPIVEDNMCFEFYLKQLNTEKNIIISIDKNFNISVRDIDSHFSDSFTLEKINQFLQIEKALKKLKIIK